MSEGTVTGAPSEMAANREELTPMMTQYLELCEAYPDSLVLFQVGDFYEAFCGAAEETARVLEITLTAREDSSGEYAMSGIPIDNAAGYIDTLLDHGYRVAIADQVQKPEDASGVVDRAVTRVVTPGTVTDDELVEPSANYVAALAESADEFGLAFVDVSTGEFLATGPESEGALREEMERYDPAELVLPPGADPPEGFAGMVTEFDAFGSEAARDALSEHVGGAEAVLESEAELRACGAVLAYAEHTQGGSDGELGHVSRVRRYDPREYLGLDAAALRSLEVFENREGATNHTLFDALDETASALGRRELDEWLRHPLVDAGDIERRLGAVEELRRHSLAREEARGALSGVYDLERLVTRVSRGRADARDLRSLADTLDAVPEVKAALADAESDLLRSLRSDLDELADVRGLVGRAIREHPPQEITEGGVIAAGFDEELDDLRETEREGRAWVADLEEQERERTGIDSLSVGHNEVHGYYIEVTNPNLDSVPEDYTRRQTLKNAERFYTPELKEREDEILGAAERADSLEYRLFKEVRSEVGEEADRMASVAGALAALDALASLAAVAAAEGYTEPEIGAERLAIENGRHPVVERVEDDFVPNDTDLPAGTVTVITGPNMSGKSTYMRQVAQICLLAHVGSFVPADAAEIPVLDRVFTRVGASDDIAGGQSTFMREMSELTTILHAATEDSLVLLDEVGRGTSTADGLAIARATTEFLHDEVGARCLFATHYHRLTELADSFGNVRNRHFDAERRGEGVTFRHELEGGASSSSYGVEVARMAGVPEPVVARAGELIEGEQDGSEHGRRPGGGDAGDTGPSTGPGRNDELVRRLAEADLAHTTPFEALELLNELQGYVDDA
jgi:DNA mismatch repair protein MutS